ncbi:MAG: RagB/SusD family nutrient uptake outer membrane protein, partial [Alistipes sp.]|nr:RagB/SusD family nutrient uptake outer membrane protein [Alistipes sp.]
VLLRIGAYNGEDKTTAAALVSQVRARSFDNAEKAVRTVADLEGDSCYDYGVRECTKSGSANPYADFQYEEGSIFAKDASYTEYTKDNANAIELGGLLDDLAWEFVGEHHRRQDLIRFKLDNGQNVYNGKTWFCRKTKSAIGDHHKNVMPINSEFIQSNIKLKQNFGFSVQSETVQPGA